MGIFTKRTIEEQIDKAIHVARLRWEKDKKVEFDEFLSMWSQQKEKDIAESNKKHVNELRRKDHSIQKLKQQINDQKAAFRKFKDIAMQNEILSTELSTEAEVFLQMTSKIAGTFAVLRYRAEKTSSLIEKKEERDRILRHITEIDEISVS